MIRSGEVVARSGTKYVASIPEAFGALMDIRHHDDVIVAEFARGQLIISHDHCQVPYATTVKGIP